MVEIDWNRTWLPMNGNAFAAQGDRMRMIDLKTLAANELDRKRSERTTVQQGDQNVVKMLLGHTGIIA